MATFRITMSAGGDAFQVSMGQSGEGFSVAFGAMSARPVVPYPGPYVVTPKAAVRQQLATAETYLTEDVTVLEIPYFETSNVHGSTVHIAPAE